MAVLTRPRSIRFIQMLRLAVVLFVAVAGFFLLRGYYGNIAIYVVDIPLAALILANLLTSIWMRQPLRAGTPLREDQLYVQVFIDVLVMAMVVFYPFIYNVIISFSNMNLMHFRDWNWIGLRNYKTVLSDSTFWYFFAKTVVWTIINLIFHVGIGVFLALLLNKAIRGKSIFRIQRMGALIILLNHRGRGNKNGVCLRYRL